MYKLTYTLLLLTVFGIFLRFYQLDKYPVHLNHDEVSQIYDAISIAQTGKDIYGNFLPTIFESVNDFKSPFYTYITSIFYLVFGPGEATVRLPAALFGSLIIPSVFIFVLKLLKNANIALASAFLTAIAPFEIFFSRKSFENGAGIFFMLLGFSFLLIFVEKKTHARWLYFASLSFAIAMYTYFSHAILMPLLILSFLIIFRREFKFSKKIITPLTFLTVLLIPLILIILTNPGSRYRSQTVFILQDPALGRQIELAKESSIMPFFYNYKALIDFSLTRYLNQFDLMYLFGYGLDLTNQGPLGMGPLYLFQLPLLLLGIYYLLNLNNLSARKKFMMAWIIIGMIPSGLTFEEHSPHRSIMVFTMLNIITAVGLYFLLNALKRKMYKFTFVFFSILITVIAANFVYFIHIYTVNYPFEKSESMHYPFEQVTRYAWSQYQNYDQIIFDPLFGDIAPVIGTAAHYYLAYYGNYPPSKFQKEYRRGEKIREVIFDKFSIRKVDWRQDHGLKNTLIIASSWSLPIDSIDKNKIKKVFNYYNGRPAFYAVGL